MQRAIALEGANNVRDLGGYETRDGRRVRWRRLFRADGLHRLTEEDGRRLAALGVEAALDLRYGPERAAEPARLPASVASVHIGLAEPPGASLLETMEMGGVASARTAAAWLTRSYADYPARYARACGTILRRLAEADAPALLFHCTAGKDRTGFASAVVLETLGVPRATVLEDYLLTNRHWDPSGRRQQGVAPEIQAQVFSAKESYLAAAWRALDRDHGGLDAWLANAVRFGPDAQQRLRAALLE